MSSVKKNYQNKICFQSFLTIGLLNKNSVSKGCIMLHIDVVAHAGDTDDENGDGGRGVIIMEGCS